MSTTPGIRTITGVLNFDVQETGLPGTDAITENPTRVGLLDNIVGVGWSTGKFVFVLVAQHLFDDSVNQLPGPSPAATINSIKNCAFTAPLRPLIVPSRQGSASFGPQDLTTIPPSSQIAGMAQGGFAGHYKVQPIGFQGGVAQAFLGFITKSQSSQSSQSSSSPPAITFQVVTGNSPVNIVVYYAFTFPWVPPGNQNSQNNPFKNLTLLSTTVDSQTAQQVICAADFALNGVSIPQTLHLFGDDTNSTPFSANLGGVQITGALMFRFGINAPGGGNSAPLAVSIDPKTGKVTLT